MIKKIYYEIFIYFRILFITFLEILQISAISTTFYI